MKSISGTQSREGSIKPIGDNRYGMRDQYDKEESDKITRENKNGDKVVLVRDVTIE